ncbi:MAG: glycosyltransferase family 1 protein, partial [Planctomycetota bacterium]
MTRPDVVLLSTAEWGNPFWTNKQHVACELARRGHRVFYIDSLGLRRPSASRSDLLRIFRRLARGMKAPRKVRDGILVWSPLVLPLHGNPVVGRLNRLWLERMLALWLRRFGFRRDWFWTYNPLTTRFLRSGRFGRVVYHCVDEIAAQPGMPAELITRHE